MPELLVAGRPFESVLLAASLPLVASVIGSRVSTFAGLPALLVFLGVGMLAGSEGPGGIEFTNYPLTFALGSVALAFILFDAACARAGRTCARCCVPACRSRAWASWSRPRSPPCSPATRCA